MKKSNYRIETNSIEDTFLAIIKSIGLILLLIIYEYIPLIILYSFGIKFNRFSFFDKICYLIISNILFMFFLCYIYRKMLKKDIIDFKNNMWKYLKTAIKYWLIGIAIMYASSFIIHIINGGGLPENEKAVRELMEKAPIFMFFQISIYAPFTEEMIFRKSIRDAIKNPYVYIIISGLIFGGMHLISGGISFSNLLYLIPYGVLGSIFAALYYKTDNIFSSMSVHSIHNVMSFLLLLIGKMF